MTRSCEDLRPRITLLVGCEGYRALLARALALAKRDLPALSGVQVDDDGSLTGFDEVLAGQGPAEAEAGNVAILARFLALLESFIGVELTRQLAQNAWPDAPVGETGSGTKESAA